MESARGSPGRWSILPFEGEADPGKTQFLVSSLLKIHDQAGSGTYDAAAGHNAVWDLIRFAKSLTAGEVIGADGRPTCS